jgi:hypothetical protein
MRVLFSGERIHLTSTPFTSHNFNPHNSACCCLAEVLRQQAIAGGAGGTRVPVKRLSAVAAAAEAGAGGEGAGAGAKGGKGAGRGPKGSMGYEGEDVVSGWTGELSRQLL